MDCTVMYIKSIVAPVFRITPYKLTSRGFLRRLTAHILTCDDLTRILLVVTSFSLGALS